MEMVDSDKGQQSAEWSNLPEHILVHIFRHLPLSQAYKAALTCRSWLSAFRQPRIWRTVEFSFCRAMEEDEKLLRALDEYGEHFRNVTLKIDQGEKENRRLGVAFLFALTTRVKNGQIRRLKMEFVGTNPLFYGGQEFVDALLVLFTDHKFEYVDLSRTPVMYTDQLFSTLASNHFPNLKYLNIQTKQFICKIQPECILDMVRKCKNLVDLRVCHSSLSNEVLIALNDPNRSPIRHLSILCRRQEKYFHHDLTEETWQELVSFSPRVEVTLKFDPTCPLEKAREIMKPQIPVKHLFMEMYTNAHEIALAVEYYHRNLRKLVVQAKSSPFLESALVDAVEWCRQLTSLHVMCLLDRVVVEEIFRRRPQLKSYTLKYEMEPHPWVTDEILDELPEYV